VDLHGKMTLGEVKSSEKGLCSRYKVTKFPTILVVKPGQKKPIKYDQKVIFCVPGARIFCGFGLPGVDVCCGDVKNDLE
jgi:hypothetical protein